VTSTKRWHVSVVEFYLRSFQPDSTDITIRRNTSIDFLLDIASIEGVDLDYEWALTGRQEGEIEGEDSVNVNFVMTGDYELAAQISGGENIEEVSWNIHVVSALWWWWPHELSMEVPVDTLIEFEVFPFNEESDSLEYLWKLNGDTLSYDAEEFITFRDIGQHEVQAFLWDGSDVDSVSWTITAIERNEVNNGSLNELPNCVELFAPIPNPFNSKTKITFNIPFDQIVRLEMFDISGRRVSELINGRRTSGRHEIIFNSEKHTTGIYFINLVVGDEHKTQKLVLIK